VSKARLVISAVVIEGRSQSEVARANGVSQSWISRLVARYRVEGDAAFVPRSRRPHTSPARLPVPTVDLIVELREKLSSKGLDAGPATIAWHLHHHGLTVSTPSIMRHLRAAGLITPTPKKRSKASYMRFAAELPNERWQADFTHWWLAEGTHAETVTPSRAARDTRSTTGCPAATSPAARARTSTATGTRRRPGLFQSGVTDSRDDNRQPRDRRGGRPQPLHLPCRRAQPRGR
jgi:transposase